MFTVRVLTSCCCAGVSDDDEGASEDDMMSGSDMEEDAGPAPAPTTKVHASHWPALDVDCVLIDVIY